MTLQERLGELIAACFTGIWIESYEHQEAIVEIAELCRNEDWQLVTWDVDRGLSATGDSSSANGGDPLAAIRSLAPLSGDQTTLLVMKNLHRFIGSTEIMQALQEQLIAGKQNRTIVVALSPVVSIPPELEKLFVVIDHPLPGREQLSELAAAVATEDGELPDDSGMQAVLDSATGLTRLEAENAFSLSLVRHGRVTPEAVWELKTGMLKKSGLLELHRSEDDFATLGGLNSLKAFCKRSLLQPNRNDSRRQARGVLLLGVPGTGKSAFAKALGKETGRPTLILDVGALFGSLVGQTEQNIRQALKIADAMAPCILFIDELEKALGNSGAGSGDSGVSSRLFGTLLSWMNDHTSNVYLIATCNDISKLPPEMSRAERFDGIVFLDLPRREQKDAIWRQYTEIFDLDSTQAKPNDDQWTGAEIRACCRLAALLDVPLTQSARNIVPVAVTASESVERLRSWASGRCLDAENGGIYQHGKPKSRTRRKVSRGPSMN